MGGLEHHPREPDLPSQSGNGHYTVTVTSDGSWFCSCPDHEETLDRCKHIQACEITVQRETGKPASAFSEVVKVTYSQDWTAYNLAQTNEKPMFLQLLADLCSGIEQPEGAATGRPRLPLADMAFAVIAKAFAGSSARRFSADLAEAKTKGFLDKTPSFNSVLNYQRDPALTPLLAGLVELSSLPLRAVETDFAIDSSGFGTKNVRTWFSTKHGRVMESRDWRKVHVMAGVRTHIVTAVQVTGASSNDAPHLPELAKRTAKHFTMNEVSADKGYLTKNNAAEIEALGATPFIPFKVNSMKPVEGSAWARMWHMFEYRRDTFPGGFWWDPEVADWLMELTVDLNARVFLPELGMAEGGTWGQTMGVETATLRHELERHWLRWRDEVIASGVTDPGGVRSALVARQRAWETAPHPQHGRRSPVDVVREEVAAAATDFSRRD
jgi:hypothetical protein